MCGYVQYSGIQFTYIFVVVGVTFFCSYGGVKETYYILMDLPAHGEQIEQRTVFIACVL